MAEIVTPIELLRALGVVAEAERDQHLAERMQRLARKITKHFQSCKRCKRAREVTPMHLRSDLSLAIVSRTALCTEGVNLITALGRAAAQGQRWADDVE